MKVGGSICIMLLALGCVDLNKPKEVAACAASGLCSDQPLTGGASGGETAAAGGAGGNGGVMGSGGTASTGGASATGGMTGSGGLVGSGGTIARDGSAGAGGVTRSGGASPADGAIGTGGALGSGGNSSGGTSGGASGGGVAGSGGVTGTGGDSSAGGTVGAGGATGSGGTTAAVGTGGVTGSGGKTGAGGAVTGGTVGTGGSTTTGCGTTKSAVSPTFNFATDLQALSLGPNSTGGLVKYATAGPNSNATLCKVGSGCGALVMPFTSAAAYAAYALAVENFAPSINLVGSTVTFSLAVDNPAQVPIQIQAYAQGDVTSAYAWTNPATVAGASLLPYAAAAGFKDIVLSVTNYVSTTGKYCAAVTGAIGIQLQNTAAITSSNAGTVTIYISKITITPPP